MTVSSGPMSTLTTFRGRIGDGDRDLNGAFDSGLFSESDSADDEGDRCSADEDRNLDGGRRLRRRQHLGNAGNGEIDLRTCTFEYTRMSSSRRISIKPPSRCFVLSIRTLSPLLWLDVLCCSTQIIRRIQPFA